MKTRIFLVALIVVIILSQLNAQSWWENTYSSKELDISNINIPINNVGGINRGFTGADWDHNSKNYYIVYDQGPWVVGKINENIHLAIEQWRSSYSPGPIIDNNAAMNVHPGDSAKYRVYKIGLDDTLNPGKDYLEWPAEYGADICESGFPVIYNHQMIWTSYNSLDSSINDRKVWNINIDTLPVVPIEIQQLAYASEWGQQNWIGDVVFFEWTIINKGSETIDSAYIGLWTDIDFHSATSNIPAVDSSIQLGYCWDTLSIDNYFIPLSVGHLFKYGPIIPSQGDSAMFKGRKKDDFKNIGLTSFHGIGDDSFPPRHPLGPAKSLEDAWNFAQGLDAYGNNIIDPTTGFPTKFPFSGDPVTEQGYLFPIQSTGGGAGYILFSGPFDFAPQDTQWVMAALLVSTGDDYKDAITKMRQKANTILNTPYELLVQKYSASPPPIIPPQKFYLSQNYPNPFNNETKILFDIPYRSRVVIKVYDLLGSEVKKLLDEEMVPNHYEVAFNGEGLASGIYFYQIYAKGEQPGDFLQTKKMLLLK